MMDQQEVNEYLFKVQSERIQIHDELESEIARKLVILNDEVAKKQNRLQKATLEVEQLKISIQRDAGKQEGYAQILVDAENFRRANAEPTIDSNAIQMATLRDQLGADKIQAISVAGEVLSDTDEQEATRAAPVKKRK
jgi:hypothetical protein